MSKDRDRNNKVNRAKYRALVRLGQKHQREYEQLLDIALRMEGITDYDPDNGRFNAVTGREARAKVQGKRRSVAMLARQRRDLELHQGSLLAVQQTTAAQEDYLQRNAGVGESQPAYPG